MRLFPCLLALCSVAPSLGRISELELKKERRGYVVVSSFGLLQGGSISLKWKNVRTLQNENRESPGGGREKGGGVAHQMSGCPYGCVYPGTSPTLMNFCNSKL